MKKNVIICVDDEKVVLHGLMSQLNRQFGETIKIITCESGEEALEIFNNSLKDGRDIPVIITDQLMPGLKGNDVLRNIHQISPRTCKILLTGQTDMAAVEDAVTNADLYRYLRKPWDGTDLILTITRAIELYNRNIVLEEQQKSLTEYNHRLEKSVEERTFQLTREQEKTDALLLNILPSIVAKELKEKGQIEPKQFDQVTVLFTDFKGFTTSASKTNPIELLEDLNECFSAYDEICDRHNMEKIKTIGDAFLCAGGLPVANNTNPVDALYAAWSICEWTKEWNKRRVENGNDRWDIRIGVHTGKIIAGIIGRKKFQYDLWGDAVNMASRMESNSEPGKINISATTFELIKDHFSCAYRGEIEVKNRGPIGMYFVQEIL